MRKKGIVKWRSAGFLLCLGMSFMTGCADKNVDYQIDGAAGSTQTEKTAGKKGLEQFADASGWEDEWTAVNTKGNTVTLQVDAKVRLPDTEQMSVVEAEEPVFDAVYKERIVKSIFGAGEVYYNDIAHLPKEKLTEQRNWYQELYDQYTGGDPDKMEEQINEMKRLLEKCDEAMKEAKDTYTLVQEYTTDEYLGNRDGISYELIFDENGECLDSHYAPLSCTGKEIYLMPADIYQVCLEEAKEVEDLQYSPAYHGSVLKNQCEFSEEEAQKLAQDFVDRLDMGYSVCVASLPLVWSRASTTGFSSYESADGYSFVFDAGIDNISFVLPGTQEDYDNFARKEDAEEPQYYMKARIEVYVNGNGVIGMKAQNPVEITGISGETRLLDLEAVEGIMKEQTMSHIGTFRFDYSSERRVVFNDLELIYFRVRDKENPGQFSYIPVWRLADVPTRTGDGEYPYIKLTNPVLINAIDGSVIDFYDEV